MEIKISKRDVFWNYIAQFFNLGSGFIVLPVVLHMLSSDEVGMNYLMLSISSLVALADFGFSSQFGRNITYVFSGAQELKKEGMSDQLNGDVNYHLLAVVIQTAKFIYRRISVFALVAMLTFGSLYMYRATEGFSSVQNSLVIWILFSISTYFSMYFLYYNSLLTGAALMMESRKATMLNKISYIVISFILLFMGLGLMSLVVAGLISPFIGRWYSYSQFYKKELLEQLSGQEIQQEEVSETFNILWYNAKKLGINFLGAYGIQQSGTFIIGLFLTLNEIASYGLMCQLYQVSTALALGVFSTLLPVFYKDRVEGNVEKLTKDFSFSAFVYVAIFTILGAFIIILGKPVLEIMGSRTQLPIKIVLIIYFIQLMLENFHSICATMIVTNNQVPFVKAAIVSGVCVVLCYLCVLKFTSWGLVGIVSGQLIVQSLYNHWKWPLWIFKELNLTLNKMFSLGLSETYKYMKAFSVAHL